MYEKTSPSPQTFIKFSEHLFIAKQLFFLKADTQQRSMSLGWLIKKYPLRSSCKVLSLGNKMVYKSVNHKINNIARKLSGNYSDSYFANMFNRDNCTIEAHYLWLKRLNYCLQKRFSDRHIYKLFPLQTTTLVPRLPGMKVPSNQPPSTL